MCWKGGERAEGKREREREQAVTDARRRAEKEGGDGERECARFRQSGAASALGPVWLRSLIKKPHAFTQRHKTAARDESQPPRPPPTRCTRTNAEEETEDRKRKSTSDLPPAPLG